VDNKFFCDVTTTQDPVLDRLAVEQVGDVYATDAILAHLMAAPRSVYR
jgi:translation initiation factor 3 subunit D